MTRTPLINALIGAVVSVVLSFIPLSPVIGGAVAGYLEERDGVRIGAISGAMAAVPMMLVFGLFISVVLFGASVGGGMALLAMVGVVAMLYTVTLSALGGYVGVYLADRQAERGEAFRVEGAV